MNVLTEGLYKQEHIYDALSYGTFLDDVAKFKAAGGRVSDDFNAFDVPSMKYFKIFFYFINGDNNNNGTIGASSGLLAPTWQIPDLTDDDYWRYTSAWSYLKINDDNERAELLEQFVNLLSNISTFSPWYFQSVEGLSDALKRTVMTSEKFAIEPERRKITIKCLPDAYDNRIGTLLDLYRTIAYSYQLKKEILPANLRKFDMGIYLFESPIKNMHGAVSVSAGNDKSDDETDENGEKKDKEADKGSSGNFARIGSNNKQGTALAANNYITSYKYFEFHNCEIDYNSSSSAWGEVSNGQEGYAPTYSITINYDDCYESSYNEFLMRTMGDIITIDSQVNWYGDTKKLDNIDIVSSKSQADDVIATQQATADTTKESMTGEEAEPAPDTTPVSPLEQLLYARSDIYKNSASIASAYQSISGTSLPDVIPSTGIIKKYAVGNLFSLATDTLGNKVMGLIGDNTWNAIRSAKEYAANIKRTIDKYTYGYGSLGELYDIHMIPESSIVSGRGSLGNIFMDSMSKSMASNI